MKAIHEKKRLTEWMEKFHIDEKVIVPVVLSIQAFLLIIGMQAITFADYNVLYQWLSIENIGYVIYAFLLSFLLLQLFLCVFKRITLGFIITCLLTILIAVINNMKWVSLKECITISDFDKLSEAFTVASEADFKLFVDWWGCVIGVIILLVLTVVIDIKIVSPHRMNTQFHYYNRTTFFLLILILLPIIIADAKGSAVDKLTHNSSADKMGPVIYFMESIFTAHMDDPYTFSEAKKSYDQYVEEGKALIGKAEDKAENEQNKPNIIVIMSEAFFDVNQFEGVLTYSENPMAYYEKMQEESVAYGNAKVNIYGGSTHFSEFEFLSGWNSKGMNSGSCPYKEYYNEKQPSFASYLNEMGYYTLAIHPYDSFFWNRKHAYPNMGFDKFIDRSYMKYTDMCGYISDDALTNEVIYRYEERKNIDSEEPFFCFGVSIANHVAMINGEEFLNTADHIDITYEKNIGYSDRRRQRVKDYIGGISKSGEALYKLASYFKEQDEPTVIVFFGDHAPNYAIDIMEKKGKEEDCYTTPYLIWSNYEIADVKNEADINISYLSTYLLQTLHMPLTMQNYYNIALHNQYRYETRYEICDVDGELYEDMSSSKRDAYFYHALDMKKHIPALLAEPEKMQEVWQIP